MSNVIKGYSIQNGEPTPDNPVEIESLDIEEDIKFIDEMIKEYNTFGDLDNPDYEDTDRTYKAIENILKKIKELEEENKIQRKQIMSAYNRGWIPKEKVKDEIEALRKMLKATMEGKLQEYTPGEIIIKRNTLEELLEESK